jgi:hypothetical protein
MEIVCSFNLFVQQGSYQTRIDLASLMHPSLLTIIMMGTLPWYQDRLAMESIEQAAEGLVLL